MKKVHKGDADKAARAPDEEHARLEIGVALAGTDKVGGGIGDGPVEQPVGGGGHGQALGADLEWEDLAGDDPGDGTPGAGKEEDVEADKGDESLGRRVELVGGGLTSVGGQDTGVDEGDTDSRDNELADTHANSTPEEEWAATSLLNKVKTREGRDGVDNVSDEAIDEGAANVGIGKVGNTVVEDEVNTCELLERLECTSGKETLAN